MSEEGAGRARGRARGRPAASVSSELNLMTLETVRGDGSASPGSGEAETGTRGRGGLRTRPASIENTVGDTGVPVRMFANYIKVNTPDGLAVQQYHVDFSPEVESTMLRRSMLYETTKQMLNNAFLFDGMHDLKSLARLPQEVTDVIAVRRTDNQEIKITIKFVGEMGWGSFEMLRLYNTQMRRNLQHIKYILMGRHYFNPDSRKSIPEFKLHIWSGVTTAVALHDGGTLMNVDTVHKVVRADTARDVLREVFGRGRDQFQDNARRELAGSIVMTKYNNKTYKIDDIDFKQNPSCEFERKGQNTTFVKYYKDQYNVEITDLRQPLLICLPDARMRRAETEGPPKPMLLIPELCCMTGLTESLRTNFNLKKSMTQMTQLVPKERFTNLKEFIKIVNDHPQVQQEMGQWNLSFGNMPVEVVGRRLECEKILMKGDTPASAAGFNQQSGDFSKEMRGKAMRESPGELSNWAIVVSARDAGIVDDFGMTLARVSLWSLCQITQKSDMILSKNSFAVKSLSLLKLWSVAPLSKKQMLMSVCTKIGIQMASKLGGVPWALNIPAKKVMIVGYDTYHDSSQKNKSAGAFVCTLNPEQSKYYSRVSYHTSTDEMSAHFANNLTNGLQEYYKINKVLPDRVIIYRDGVSEGQIPHVFNFEVTQVRNALSAIAQAEKIKLTFIIVTKRIGARFFAKGQPPNLENPMPGTIVDTVVTRPERYEFYLVSQSVRQGTVAPTCFNIIIDESGWKPSIQQMLAYKLCHLYYNWMGTIRVPAPCQYAHKLAFLVGTSLHREPNVSLSDKLYYL
ncbi:Piwi-like protein 1 [Halotydeus destructor]|nr:Piwi-like protein 1 [Halotydeus destructor]